MRPRARHERTLIRNRRRGCTPQALLGSPPLTLLAKASQMHPIEQAMLYDMVKELLVKRMFEMDRGPAEI